ncbi:MAG: amidase [Alphaproteobacteria bacterium]|nr:amidase [Alphaproteobacteria bacterium]
MAGFAEYRRYDALGLAELIARKQVRPDEVLEAAIARIEAWNPRLNAIVHRMDEAARATLAKGPKGPFAGVPFLLKDLYAFDAGHPVTNGSRFWKGFLPDHDITLVERYKAAGLVICGRTNTPELGLTMATEPAALGICRNPWNLERSAGGSSGGSAAAVAARIVPMAHATDGGGSIRIPAANCGLVGLKPTRARNPAGPDVGEGWSGLATGHCVSITVRDSAALLDATNGPAPGDPYAAPPPARPYAQEVGADPGRLRVGLVTAGPGGEKPHVECVAGAVAAGKLCESLGHHVEETEFRFDVAQFVEAMWTVIPANVANTIDLRAKYAGRAATRADVEPLTWAMAELGRKLPASAYARAVLMIHGFGRQVARMYQRFDVLLSPVLTNPPLPFGRTSMQNPDPDAFRTEIAGELLFTPIYNVSGCPAMSLPLHWTADGLPVGIQIGAAFGNEAVLFRLAAQLEKAKPWRDRTPPGA